MKIDGHTHTHFCPHGSGDELEKMIQRAIALDFDQYHVTEHLPLSKKFMESSLYAEKIHLMSMREEDLDDYVKEVTRLKEKYKSDLEILLGFEVDHIPGEEAWVKEVLQEYGPYTQCGNLSVHMMTGAKGIRILDYSPEETLDGLVEHYGSGEAFQLAYYDTVLEGLEADHGQFKPKKVGHLALCQKFEKALDVPVTETILHKIEEVLRVVAGKKMALDFNVAGLYIKECENPYIPHYIFQKARALGIPMIYGSDSHAVAHVGRAYEVYEDKVGGNLR